MNKMSIDSSKYDEEINNILAKFANVKIVDKCVSTDMNTQIIKIQKVFRGYIARTKLLPLMLYKIQTYLKTVIFQSSNHSKDGRINSCSDEDSIVACLLERFGDRIKQSPKPRFWYDILAYDYTYGWIPINIKTTTTKTSDNIGNFSICVYAYTDEMLDLQKTYTNGDMSKKLLEKLTNKEYNKKNKKDYFFLVLNKNNANDIIVNSVKGLSLLTANANNLPFQICWNKNREFKYETIHSKIKLFIECLQSTKPSWSEEFMADIRKFKL